MFFFCVLKATVHALNWSCENGLAEWLKLEGGGAWNKELWKKEEGVGVLGWAAGGGGEGDRRRRRGNTTHQASCAEVLGVGLPTGNSCGSVPGLTPSNPGPPSHWQTDPPNGLDSRPTGIYLFFIPWWRGENCFAQSVYWSFDLSCVSICLWGMCIHESNLCIVRRFGGWKGVYWIK